MANRKSHPTRHRANGPPSVAAIPAKVAVAYREHVDQRGRVVLRAWLSFAVMFGVLRGITYGIRYHVLPIGNVVAGGLHIHHFVWGILLLLVVGGLALLLEQARWHPWLAIPFGVGAALVVDEFALWLNLEDVYWATAGRSSVDLAIGIIALGGIYLAAVRFWHIAAQELHRGVHASARRLVRPPR